MPYYNMPLPSVNKKRIKKTEAKPPRNSHLKKKKESGGTIAHHHNDDCAVNLTLISLVLLCEHYRDYPNSPAEALFLNGRNIDVRRREPY